jgi:hypothetical protein
MEKLDSYDRLYIGWSFIFQVALILVFSVRKIDLGLIYRYGWIFYALSIPAVIVSITLLRGGKTTSFWLAGFVFLVWAIFGFIVEYVLGISWRNPVSWPILIPYVILYLTTVMFYWWPVGLLWRPLWYLYAALFALSTYLNLTSH